MSRINQNPSKNSLSRWEKIVMLCEAILERELQSEERFSKILRIKSELIKKYEDLYNNDSPDGFAMDSKKVIQCLSNKIEQFTKERNFYYLFQSINSIFSKIEYHFENFRHIELEESIFSSIKDALEIHKKSLNILRSAFIEFSNMRTLNDYTKKNQMERWAVLLEEFAEELKPNILFFSFEMLSEIEELCNDIFLKTIKKKSINCKREEYRRRLHYSVNFILNIVNYEFVNDQESNQNTQDPNFIDSSQVIKLDAQDSKAFVENFLNPQGPNEALISAALYYKRMMPA